MFRLAQPIYLYLLILLPILWGLFLYARHRRKRNLALFGNIDYLPELASDISRFRPWVKLALQSLALLIIIFILARPQFGSKLQTVKTEGVEIMVALDVSNSMLARDVNPSRLEKSKMILSKLVDDLENDKLGLVVFAGDAYTQLPITTDYVSAKMFLNNIRPDMVPTQGTAVGQAINMAMNSFSPESTAEQAIILITDAENHEDDAIEAARKAAERGIKVCVVGVGTTQGTTIPIAGSSNNFMKDAQGNTVVTKLDETIAQDIAREGKGIYVRADNTNAALTALIDEVRRMKSTEFDRKTYSEYNEQFPGLAWMVLVILLIDVCILERKYGFFSSINFFTKK